MNLTKIVFDSKLSGNFHLAKALAIITVVCGHYFSGLLWMPALASLYIFGFSSGFFTGLKYKQTFDIRSFWKSKIPRLFIPLLVFQLFVFGVCLAFQHEGLFHWDTMLAFPGLSGVLRWLDMERVTPMGNGLWFLTLLWLFYLLFPLLQRLLGQPLVGGIVVLGWALFSLFLEAYAWQGVFFYTTSWSFVFGCYIGLNRQWIDSRTFWIFEGIAIPTVILIKALVFPHLSGAFLIMLGTLIPLHVMLKYSLPFASIPAVRWMSSLMLGIYVIHGYLFVRIDYLGSVGSFALTVILILIVAESLTRFSDRFVKYLATYGKSRNSTEL